MNEDQLLDWSKANTTHWGNIRVTIGATEGDTLEDLSEIAPEDYEEAVHELAKHATDIAARAAYPKG